jgi:hypothetical protein
MRGEMFLTTRRPRGIADQDVAIDVEAKRKTDADAVPSSSGVSIK